MKYKCIIDFEWKGDNLKRLTGELNDEKKHYYFPVYDSGRGYYQAKLPAHLVENNPTIFEEVKKEFEVSFVDGKISRDIVTAGNILFRNIQIEVSCNLNWGRLITDYINQKLNQGITRSDAEKLLIARNMFFDDRLTRITNTDSKFLDNYLK